MSRRDDPRDDRGEPRRQRVGDVRRRDRRRRLCRRAARAGLRRGGRRVVLVETDAGRVEKLRRGESYIEDVPSKTLGPLVSEGRLGATTDTTCSATSTRSSSHSRRRSRSTRAGPLDHRRGGRRDPGAPAAGPPGGPGVHDVPGDDPGRAPPRARKGVRPRRGEGLPPRLLARAGRPRPRRLDDEDRPHRSVGGIDEASTDAAARAPTARPWTRCTGCRRRRRPS